VPYLPSRAPGALSTLFLVALLAAPAPTGHATELPAAPPTCSAVNGKTHALPLRALDLAFLGPDRLVVLDASEIALLAVGERGVTLLSRRALPASLEVVRWPGALLQGSERDGAVWAITSVSPRAVLFAIDGGVLVEREQADALPFPGCPRGLRFRAGTNLVDGEVERLGSGPFLDLTASDRLAAVSPDGRLLIGDPAETAPAVRVGPTLAPLWPGWIAASTAAPPDQEDALLVFSAGAAAPAMSCRTPGPVRALAARAQADAARVAVAMDEGETGRSSLLLVDLVRPRP
jgi:hypothetical protein